MKVSYRGHEINVYREKCLAGYKLLYYSVFRESDQFECTSGYSEGCDTVRYWIKYLKERIDEELTKKKPWA